MDEFDAAVGERCANASATTQKEIFENVMRDFSKTEEDQKCVFVRFPTELAARRAIKEIDLLLSFLKIKKSTALQQHNDPVVVALCMDVTAGDDEAFFADLAFVMVIHMFAEADSEYAASDVMVYNAHFVGLFGQSWAPAGFTLFETLALAKAVKCTSLQELRWTMETIALQVPLTPFATSNVKSVSDLFRRAKRLVTGLFDVPELSCVAECDNLSTESEVVIGLTGTVTRILSHAKEALEHCKKHSSKYNTTYIRGLVSQLQHAHKLLSEAQNANDTEELQERVKEVHETAILILKN
eukprot:TRINITY_DN17198_c0_g2_i1.p1 TRINITY_DN17198_c0_g2~~TRINITY_DN17198_c0_g2_i1.p1  ORF type:complete len:298 (-),score=21.71 TRINITY_DN17198_c0_g2_i1:71-964(-)